MLPSVIISTYNQPRYLELVLTGFSCQSHHDFEVVIADDGSGPDTGEVVRRAQGEMGLRIVHAWHPDRGFRKTEILNRALLAAGGDYLIFTDGDCIPRSDFVEQHVREAERSRFLSGGYLKLPEELSSRLSAEDVRSGRLFDPGWLRKEGWRSGRRVFRLTRDRRVASMLDFLTPTRATWNGSNASTWREALMRVNGFDLDMGYGGEDRAAGERLENIGYRGKQIRFRAPCVHLHHERPYRKTEILRKNREIRDRIHRRGETRARIGIEEMLAEDQNAEGKGTIG